jgi:hypothetical protein
MALVLTMMTSSCGLILLTATAAAGLVGLTGFAVYEGGKAVVSGGEAVASGVSDAGKSGKRAVGEVIYDGKVFTASCPYRVTLVTAAAHNALRQMRFRSVKAKGDAMSGDVSAITADGVDVTIEIDAVSASESSVAVRYGVKGDFQRAEMIYSEILRLLDQQQAEEAN